MRAQADLVRRTMYQIRSMETSDIAAILAIQTQCYPALLLESEDVIRERLQRCAAQCWVAEDEIGVCAYLFGYLSRVGKVTPLDAIFTPDADADCLYVHDLAVLPRKTGCRVGPALVEHNLQQAREHALPYSALVSVQNSSGFWERLGYQCAPSLDAQQQQNLDSYGIPALYMVKEIA